MAEEFDLHLLEFTRAEGEVSRRDFVAKALASLSNSEWDFDSAGIHDVLEIDKDSLSRFGAQEGRVFLAAQCAEGRFEHQIELARLGQRVQRFRVGSQYEASRVQVFDVDRFVTEGKFFGVFVAEFEELHRFFADRFFFLLGVDHRGDKDLLFFFGMFGPASAQLVKAISFFRFAAIDHVVMEQVVVSAAFPDLRVHDDRAIEPDHLKSAGSAAWLNQFVVASDHVRPPRFLEISFEFNPQRAVVPEPLDAAVDLAGLKEESTFFTERDDFVHRFHGRAVARIQFFSGQF